MQSDLSGQRLGRYVLKRVLGRGGMGEVYEALDPETGRTVAIKVLPATLSAQPGYLDRFHQELKLAASLEHIHILPIYDHGSENGTTYIVMRFLTGSDLQNRLHKLGRPSTLDARKLLRQIGDALDYAHSRGVVHRDLKPNNIMFDDRGNAYLGDFGIAKVLGTASGLTGTGQILGTPYYMAPEQVKGDDIDARADIYSLGIIAFQLLTGQLPFNAPTPYAVMYKHLSDEPPLPSDLQGNLDSRVDEVIHTALAKDPDHRFQSAREFVEALDATLSNIPESEQRTGFMTVQVDTKDTGLTYTPPRTPKSRTLEKKRRLPFSLMAALFGVIAVAVFAVVMLTGGDDTEPTPTAADDVAAQVSDTPEPLPTDTVEPTGIPTLSLTEVEEATQSNMESAFALQTSVARDGLTQTATLWTPTPTLDPIGTADARLTATSERESELNLTATATLWTATPTETDLPTDTPVPTEAATSTATVTPPPTAVAFDVAETGVTANAEWEPLIQEFDGVEMVLVPAGCFMMGSTEEEIDYALSLGGEREWYSGEQPVHEICFDEPFWIDRYEVTQGEFARLGGTQAKTPYFPETERPVDTITWFEARDFCALRKGRLPTEAEWEYAARGPDRLIFPWGNEFVSDNVVYGDVSDDHTAPVGSRPGGVSWVGAHDLSGNVFEWLSTVLTAYPYHARDGREDARDISSSRGIRGGSWGNSSFIVRSAYRLGRRPDETDNGIGFRCARNYAPGMPSTSVEPTPPPNAFTLAESGVTTNAEWEPVIQEFDSVEMILIPAGCFMMGTESGTPEERPVHKVCFDEPFWLDRHEVTQGDFARLGGTQARSSDFTGADRPVEQITWFEARDFCEMRDGRLPTEAEWEYAARGPDDLLYPWGNEFEEGKLVYSGNIDGQTAPVGSRPDGASWVGAFDLTGNLWEWTSTVIEPYPYVKDDGRESTSNTTSDRVMRGGSWFETDLGYYRTTYRGTWHPDGWINFGGFRCARDYP